MTISNFGLTNAQRGEVNKRGWSFLRMPGLVCQPCIEDDLLGIARTIGTPTSTRGGNMVDVLRPVEPGDARPRSLSAMFGQHAQPWHVDLSHRAVPARYILLMCQSSGSAGATTDLINVELFLHRHCLVDAFSEPFLVRSGKRSFYATLLTKNRSYLRFDPGCMQGVTDKARLLMRKLLDESPPPCYSHIWNTGDLLVIDNWKMLHKRADARYAPDRTLLRVSVMGDEK